MGVVYVWSADIDRAGNPVFDPVFFRKIKKLKKIKICA